MTATGRYPVKKRMIAILGLVILTGGCANESLKPWDRDLLAEQKMQLVPNPMDEYLNDHIYFSKEASSGGKGVGGGGCGCN
jgi:hypothetical protein